LVKDIKQSGGKERAFALYNPSDEKQTIRLDFKTIDLKGPVQLYDCYLQTDYTYDRGPISFTIPPHGTKIFRAKGKKRLERTRYEAETAFLSQYQELRNHVEKETAVYHPHRHAKGGYVAGFLGRRAENDLQWQHVNIMKPGKRTITIGFFSGEARDFSVEVNGKFVKTIHAPARDWEDQQTVSVEVDFKKGDNVVRLYNAQDWMPDIDFMEIAPARH
ncbi:MAG: alpha-galactosidase, partial [Prevotella sp.]|nr:alpha-galactosidase [Prevotella sp.]